jgi:hypothetical protein
MSNPPLINKAVIGTILIAAVVVLGIWNLNFPGEKTIRVGEIEVAINTGAGQGLPRNSEIKGSFMVYTPILKLGSIQSQGIGGACLVADLNQFGKPDMSGVTGGRCKKNSDCQVSRLERDAGWAGYCDGGTGICWIRPGGDEFCNRSKDYIHLPELPPPGKIWEDGIKNTIPKEPHYFQGLFPLINWRVVACLNETNSTDCGGDDGIKRIEVFGKIKSVPYKPF